MSEPIDPGVYIEETSGDLRTIVGVSTSIALFIGRAGQGPLNTPTRCLDYTDFVRIFSDEARFGEMPFSVRLFFANGGVECYVVRIEHSAARASAADDSSSLQLTDYTDAFPIIDEKVDLFNLMVLPADSDPAASGTALWGPASTFCRKRRALLLMDAPTTWKDVRQAIDPSTGVNSLRAGLVNDHAALFYPRVTINENGLRVNVGPSGAIAGLMARIDGSRGVWKAPAGTEAAILGIVGLEHTLSDQDIALAISHAINTLRVLPEGIVNWGARTMDGDDDFNSEYKYIPVRRLALYVEESLYRGTQWAVFEPNGEPLWAQIRLSVGAFMQNLFLQGAFQGETPREAYFVKCDSETTTSADLDLGIVNIVVGFAPLKPAEFVIIEIQQIADSPCA